LAIGTGEDLADEQNPTNEKVKRRKIRRSDWLKVQEFLKKELARRKDSPFRKAHEAIWTEVDRQVQMQPMKKMLPGGKEAPPSWHSAFELGELSKASEVITADVMRLIFPQSRTYMEAHVKPPTTVDPNTGKAVIAVDPKKQKLADGTMRSLMVQQQIDFGHKARVELSVKEALHHGSFVATAEWDSQNKVYDGQGLESLEAPVWEPHSMWNCFPDPSPSIVPGAIFYPGSMMITSYMPRHKVLQLSGDGYMNISSDKIPKAKTNKQDTDDVEIVTYYGDLVIERDDGDIYLPNSKCKTANGTVIYYSTNPLPFPEVIYTGYERQDVRDPYFTSPIVKNSPIQKLATILANKFIDIASLHGEPPVTYDGNDAYLVANGGPDLWPGAKSPTKGSNKVTEIKVGDPKALLDGLQLALIKLEEGTAVNAIRSGGQDSDRKTATEVQKTSQGAEVRTVDFVAKLEATALRPFLYMQHELNLKYMKSYSFYCQEKGLPDFLTMQKKDLPKIVHFEIVGSKGLLGEERRSQQMTAVTAFASQNPLFAPLLNAPQILIDMYEDAGVKGAEEYVNTKKPQIPPEAQAQMQQMQQVIQELQQKLQEAEANMQAEMAKLAMEKQRMEQELSLKASEAQFERSLSASEHNMDRQAAAQSMQLERQKMREEMALKEQQIRNDFAAEIMKINANHEAKMKEIAAKAEEAKAEAKVKKSVSIKRTADGYRASED
jgi:hypothetical protein